MDALDRRLLRLLREDGSLPLKTLAAAVGRAPSTVQERIRRLLDDGVIRRFTIEVAEEDRAALAAVLMIVLRRTPMPEVVRQIVARPEVRRCYSLSGEIDLLVEIAGDGVDEINRSRDDLARLDGVAAVRTAFVLKDEKP